MSWTVGLPLIILGVLATIRVIIFIVKFDSMPPNPWEKADILKIRNGNYVPTFDGHYIFITTSGKADYWSSINNWNQFKTHEEAQKYLDQWIKAKGIEVTSVGLLNTKGEKTK